MSSTFGSSLSRPRSSVLVFLLLVLFTSVYLFPRSQNTVATGYIPPTPVLPSYISSAHIPLCMPNDLAIPKSGSSSSLSKMLDEEGTGSEELNGGVTAGHGSEDTIPANGITQYMQSAIAAMQAGFDPKADDDYLGLKVGATWNLTEYQDELLAAYDKYLSVPHIPTPSFLPPLLSRLSLRPPIHPLPPRPNQIITTDKHHKVEDLPWEFKRWSEIMPDWKIRYYDDSALEKWVGEMFGGTKAETIWKRLPRPVLKADVFRYMAMLVEGGIYTDSDTAPIIHADLWGYPYQNGTSEVLTHLNKLLSLSHDHSSGAQGPFGLKSTPFVDDGAELGPPSLVVSVESDAIEFGWDNWREVGLSRAVQIVQWTFMARPGHPVFLDAIHRSLVRSEEIYEMERKAKAKGEKFMPDSALDWTGPGVFTDCVYRYLLTRYGFKPRDLLHQKVPIRVGDVLILPAGSYSSVSPFQTKDGQRDWAASFHGFFGRWRDDDPYVKEFERLKKIREEEEERVKKEKEEAEEKKQAKVQEVSDEALKKLEEVAELLKAGGVGSSAEKDESEKDAEEDLQMGDD